MIQDIEGIAIYRNIIKDEWDLNLEDKVREEMLELFDNTLDSFDSERVSLVEVARVIYLTANSTLNLEATKAISKTMINSETHLDSFCNMVCCIADIETYKNVDLTIRLAETFEDCFKEEDFGAGWTQLMGNVYTSNPNFINLTFDILSFSSQSSFNSQGRMFNFIDKIRNQDYSQDSLNSLSRTINVYGDSPYFEDIILTLSSTTHRSNNQVIRKGVSDVLYRFRNNPRVKYVINILKDGSNKGYTERLVKIFNNCPDLKDFDKENLKCYLSHINSDFHAEELCYQLPFKTINSLVTTYNLIMNIFDKGNLNLRDNAESVFYQTLNNKVALGETDQEKIKIIDEWSANAYKLIIDNPGYFMCMVPSNKVNMQGVDAA